ncbi:MAG: hypothetical protein H7256_03285, partial [Bdellovibrio sp.]|nr:hypothetical protein [Bdellovibrio sp.]
SALLLAASVQFGFLQFASAGYEPCDEQVYNCQTTYERQCGYEQVCNTVPGQRECHTTAPEHQCNWVSGREECHIVPGNRECHQVQECSDAAPVCHTEQQCSTGPSTQECGLVPGHQECNDTGSRQECSNEYRCSDQPKQTCGYETVHKQCWVADPQPTLPTPPHHPPVDEPPYTPPTPLPVPAPDEPGTVDPTLPGDIETISVTDLSLDVNQKNQIVSVSLKDKGQSSKYETRYFIAINDQKDARTGGILAQDVTFVVSKKVIKPKN